MEACFLRFKSEENACFPAADGLELPEAIVAERGDYTIRSRQHFSLGHQKPLASLLQKRFDRISGSSRPTSRPYHESGML